MVTKLKVGKRYRIETVVILEEIHPSGYTMDICRCTERGTGQEWYVSESDLLPYVEKIEEGDLVRWESEDGLQIAQGIVDGVEEYDDETEAYVHLAIGECETTVVPITNCSIVKRKAELGNGKV